MKKRLLYLFMSFLLLAGGLITTQAQTAAQYNFSASSGTYTPLSGGTDIFIGADEEVVNDIPIGFTFKFAGTDYTYASVSSNGFLVFATTLGVTVNPLYTNIASLARYPILAPLWDDLQTESKISYQLTGVSPNRVFTVEWKDMYWDIYASGPVISFQAKLYEGSNKIEYIYKPSETQVVSTFSGGATIGICSAEDVYLSLNNSSASPTASSTVFTSDIITKPADGQIYTFTGSPTITGISPTSGPIAGGTSVTITGTGFTDATAVKFGSTNATSFAVNSSTQITAVSPAGSAEAIDITITTPNGTSTTNINDKFTYVPAPKVSLVAVSPNGTYRGGNILNFKVKYDAAVTVDITNGRPYIPITLNTGGTVNAVYAGYSEYDNSHNFNYQIVNGNFDADGIIVGTAIIANGGTLKSADGVDANLTLNNVASTTGVLIDAIAPRVSSVSSTNANEIYKLGDVIAITLSFSEAVTVTGTPTLSLNSGGTAIYSSGSRSTILTFIYTVGSGQCSADLDYSNAYGSLQLSGGTISDAAGNWTILNLPTVGGASSLGGQKDIVIVMAPAVTTQAVSSINSTTATGNGNITALGIPNPTTYGVCWNTTGTPTISDSKADKGAASATGAFTASMTGLTANTTYYARAFATNAVGTSYGEQVSFTTNVLTPPTATTNAATGITSTGATLNGSINANNASTTVTFEYGLDTNYGTTVTAVESSVTGSSATSVSKAITGLASGTTYHYLVKAVNAGGTTYGTDQTFTTIATAPTFTSTPTLTVPYGKPYNYAIGTTREGTLATTVTAETKPAWLSFAAEQNQFALFGTTPDQISAVAGDDEGNVYAITTDGTKIYKVDTNGTTTLWKSDLIAGYVYALHIANGYIYIPREGDSNSSITRIPLSDPSAQEEVFFSIAGRVRSLTDKDGYIYAANHSSDEVWRIPENNGNPQLILNSSNLLGSPWVLMFGNDGDLYIANLTSIRRFDGTNLSPGNTQTPTVISNFPQILTLNSIRQDKNGYFYVSGLGANVQKYTSDFSSYQSVLYSATSVQSLSLTASGALVYVAYSTKVYRLQTVGALSGTPAKTDVGSHEVVVRASNSVGSTEQRFTIEVVDNVAPVITAQTPANNATNVALKPTLSLTFDEAVNLGTTGTLTVYNGTTPLKSFDLSVPEDKAQLQLSVDRLSLSVALPENLPVNTAVTVGISAGFVKDDHNNSFAGFTADSNTWKFTTINKNEQTITFPVIDAKTYGDAAFTLGDAKTDRDLTVTYTAEDPTVVSITGNQATILKAGITKITATQAGDGLNFAATPVERTLTVNKAELTVTADNQTKAYAAANPTLTFQYSGWVNGEETIDTPPTASTTISTTSEVDTYADAITLTGGSDNNYTLKLVAGDFEVTKAELTVTADNQTKVYGSANPTLTFKYSGWVNGLETIDTPPTASTTISTTSEVDTYADAITLTGGSDNNYTLKLVAGDFEVTKAELTVTADSQTKVYGDANPELTFKYSGWKNSETETVLDTKPTVSTTVDLLTNVGTHSGAIVVSGGVDNNYSFSYVPANMEVTKAMLTVKADAKTKYYGEVNPTLTFQYSGWINDDNETVLDTKPIASTTVDKTTDVGTYEITVAGGKDNNYTFSYTPAKMQVTKATLIVTADNKTKVYGETNPELTFQYSGWVNNENETVLDTKPTASTTVNETTSVGSYKITLAGGKDNNYAFLCFSGLFEVTAPKIAGDINGDGKITLPECAGDVNGNGRIDKTEIAGDINGDGKIIAPEIAGDADGNGKIDGIENAGDINGDGEITLPELTGDVNGNSKIDETEIAGDINGDGKITSPEIAGDADGNGKIEGSEIAGDINGDGNITLPELIGDVNGNGKIDGSEVAGDANGNGKLDGNESIPTGINTTDRMSTLIAYSIGNTEIRLKGQVSGAAIAALYDIQGKVIVIKQLEAGDMNVIPTPYIKTGVYLLWVKDQTRIQTLKVPVKEK